MAFEELIAFVALIWIAIAIGVYNDAKDVPGVDEGFWGIVVAFTGVFGLIAYSNALPNVVSEEGVANRKPSTPPPSGEESGQRWLGDDRSDEAWREARDSED